jgi:hypothetical protein
MSELDMQAIADRLYGGTSASTAAPDTSAPATTTEPATGDAEAARKASFEQHGLWKPEVVAAASELPGAIAELRNSSERRMYPADVFASTVKTPDAIDLASPLDDIKSMVGIELTPETLETLKPIVAKELHAIYTDAGLSTQEAELVERVIVDVRTSKVNENPEADAANATAAIQQLTERYGKDAQAALDDARAFIARDARLGKMLETSRAGNDPRMVLLAVEAARRARARGEKF